MMSLFPVDERVDGTWTCLKMTRNHAQEHVGTSELSDADAWDSPRELTLVEYSYAYRTRRQSEPGSAPSSPVRTRMLSDSGVCDAARRQHDAEDEEHGRQPESPSFLKTIASLSSGALKSDGLNEHRRNVTFADDVERVSYEPLQVKGLPSKPPRKPRRVLRESCRYSMYLYR
ncbi:hypothetical protein FVE85_8685 [Porphyridium purpureum]|uniref:Uncharacterized protein n=1 Tax=Porphyridium purpureum TaxID=35688 RepID=A0A5J4YQH4_PORPP|nr:hypothetical protein FVE85_8685 [Porphyridium purpureum]|eukprot:POR3925..scf296_7